MPNAVLEAMASGALAILTPFIGLSEGLRRAAHECYLDVRDPAAPSASIAIILDSSGLHAKLGNAVGSRVKKTIDLKKLDRHAFMYHDLDGEACNRRLAK